jgi:uncharacterized protein YnzC (UPF0291/DUF896 family)
LYKRWYVTIRITHEERIHQKNMRENFLKKIRKGYGQLIAMMKNLVTTTPYMKNDLEV